MSTPYVGEIRMVGCNFVINGWAFCNGATISIAQNDVLFQLIGTTYGGDGVQTFNLPDLQGRVPVGSGTGPGLQTYIIGQKGGVETVTLTTSQIPSHTHVPGARAKTGDSGSPASGDVAWASPSGVTSYDTSSPSGQMGANTIQSAGGNQPHDNMMPFLTINYLISLFGVFPSQ